MSFSLLSSKKRAESLKQYPLLLGKVKGYQGTAEEPPPPPNFTKPILSGLLVGLGTLVLYLTTLPPIWGKVLIIGALWYGVGNILKRGLIKLAQGKLDMDFLMGGAAAGAVALGEWVEGGVLIVVYALSEVIQERTLDRSRRSARELLNQLPQMVSLQKEGEVVIKPIQEVKPDDLIIIRPGEIIPADGVVVEGSSWTDNSLLSGESKPIPLQPGMRVIAGGFNGEGSLIIRVTNPPGESLIHKIVTLVEEAQRRKTPFHTTIERFARYYTPAVVGGAVLLAILPPLLSDLPWSDSLYRALSLLVISCPCALVLASPTSVASALVGASRMGIIVKGGEKLEELSEVTAIAFDKTGTLTYGELKVLGIIPLKGADPDQVLAMASAVESHSEHPIARAIVEESLRRGITFPLPSHIRSHPGKGAQAFISGKEVLVGSHTYLHDNGHCHPDSHNLLSRLSLQSDLVVAVAWDRECKGILVLRDQLREGSETVIRKIRQLGITPIVMLTGDHEGSARIVSSRLEMDEVHGNLLPPDKVRIIEELKARFHKVAMVGDGVNDTPALSAASVGIAVQHHKNKERLDTALRTADIILTDGNIQHLPNIIELGRRTRKTIRLNIAAAVGVKLLFLALGSLGFSSLWMALIADEGVALGVIFNGLRLRKPPST